MFKRLQRPLTLVALTSLVSALASLSHADTIWHSDWMASAQTSLVPTYPQYATTQLAFAANGDPLLGGWSGNYSEQFVRLGADGALRWSTNLTTNSYDAYAMLATADGGAYLALPSAGFPSLVIRIAANGAKIWSRTIPAGWLVQPASDRIASANCNWLTVLDATSGSVIWQRHINPTDFGCRSGGVGADAQGNLYAMFHVSNGVPDSGFRTIKFGANGTELWNVPGSGNGGAVVVGVGNTMIYERTSDQLRGIRMGDGSIAWTAPIEDSPDVHVLVSDDSLHEPIALESGAVRRIAADTGTVRWARSLTGSQKVAANIGNAIVTTGAGSFVKLDSLTGTTAWSVARPTQDAAGHSLQWIGVGGASNGHVLAVAQPYASTVGNPSVFLQLIDIASGVLSGPISMPSVPHGMRAVSVTDAAGNVSSIGINQLANSAELRVRRLNAFTGVVGGESVDTIDDLGPGDWFSMPVPYATTVGASVATSMALNGQSQWGSRIALYNRSNGQRQWRTFLSPLGQTRGNVSEPAADANGNVFVSLGGYANCPGCTGGNLYKLDAATGAVTWQINASGEPSAPHFTMLGSDVLLQGPFADSTQTLRRLSGNDASTMWASSVFSGSNAIISVQKVDASHVIAFGLASTSMSWAKLDANTGAILWSHSLARPACNGSCNDNDELVLPNGDVLLAGERDYHAILRRFHNDGSGIVDEWDLASDDPTQASWVLRTLDKPDGKVQLILRRGFKGIAGSVHFLAGFDPDTGSLLGQQALVAFTDDAYNQTTYPDLLREIAPDHLLIGTHSEHPPEPASEGVALLDATPVAHGDLSVAVSSDRAEVVTGTTVHFHAVVTYAGDQPVQGVSVRASAPWQGGVTSLSCTTQSASNCVIDMSSGNVSATFDIQPGGSIDISGQVQVLDSATNLPFKALVYGPIGLSEQNTLNNFAGASVVQSLFFDGFESH